MSIISANDEGPNVLSGNTDLDLTKVGQRWDASVNLSKLFSDAWKYDYKDSSVVTRRDNGITTVSVNIDCFF